MSAACPLAGGLRAADVSMCRYTHPVTLALAGGVLPFGSIFIEMYFTFTSFWNYKFYYV